MFGIMSMKRRVMASLIVVLAASVLLVSCGGGGGSAGAAGSPGVDGESIHWLGSFASAPADPEQYDAYFNTADGNSYIYSGTTWDILASRGGNGTNGVTINWCGQLASAPVGANMYDAYFNTADGNSYIFNGTSWEILAQHGTNGIDGEDINWRGELGSAPSSPTVFDAYYNTGDGNSYIYTGSGWQILAHSGSNGIDGVTINWLGEFATAPTSVLENDAYYNTADGTSYIYNGTTWDHLALRGAMGPQGPTGNNGISIQWLGSFDAHPSSPTINQAYYNTADGKSYIFTGSGWQVLAQDGTDGTNGTNGISVRWLGEFDSVPPSPSINDAYYNNVSKISYIWSGSSWNVLCRDGVTGAQGAPGTPIIWKGTYTEAPSNPELNWAYYDSTVRKSFVYDGDSWEIMCQDGTSIVWLGSFASAPSNPALNNAYYDTVQRKSFIWDGDSWEIMCQDGASSSLNVSGTIAPGSYLALVHNLNRNDLTFNAQFIKYGYIYNYSDYSSLAGQFVYTKVNSLTFESALVTYVASAVLTNGNIVAAYRDGGNSNYGTWVICDQSGNTVYGPEVFEYAATSYISVSALTGGGFVIGYVDEGNGGYGTYAVFNANGSPQGSANVFRSASSSWITTTPLLNGGFAIASNDGNVYFYNASGTLTGGPTSIGFGAQMMGSCTLSSGNIVQVYYAGGPNNGFTIFTPSGTIARSHTAVNGSNADFMSVAALPNGNFVITYMFSGTYYFSIYDASGGSVRTGVSFGSTSGYPSTKVVSIGNGKFATLCSNNYFIELSIFSLTGEFIVKKSMMYLMNDGAYSIFKYSLQGLDNGSFSIAYAAQSTGYGTLGIYTLAHLALQKVDSNEVRLWNFTDETLEMMLSVDQ